MEHVRPQLVALGLMLALLAVAAAVLFWGFARPDEQRWVRVGSLDGFPPGSVTPFGDAISPLAFHVVRLRDGELLAVIARWPHPNPECVVAYRPDVVLHDRSGWFQHTCYPWIYDMAGHPARPGDAGVRALDRLTIEIRDGAVYVDRIARTRSERSPPEGYEFEAGSALLPLQWLRHDVFPR